MGILSVVGAIAGGALGFAVGGPAGAAAGASAGGKIGSSIDGKNIQTKGINRAVDIYTQGAQGAANELVGGYEGARVAKLDALQKIGALGPEEYDAAVKMLEQGQTEYVDTMIQSAETYATTLQGAAGQYDRDLTNIGNQYGTTQRAWADVYSTDINDIAKTYGGEIQQLADQLGTDFQTAAQLYKAGLEQSADQYAGEVVAAAQQEAAGYEGAAEQYGDTRMQGLSAVKSAMQPYVEGRGTPALDFLNTLMNADPAQLDPAQRRMRESFLRDSAARLAASGLRGAGRAGVAAVNEGDAALRADLYAQNRDRSIAAAGDLAGKGYGASTQVGGAGERAYTDIGRVNVDARNRGVGAVSAARQAGARYGADTRATGLAAISSAADRGAIARQQAGEAAAAATKAAGETGAATRLATGQKVAENWQDLSKLSAANSLSTGQKIANVGLETGGKIAAQGVDTNRDIVAAQGRSYDQARTVAGQVGDVNADAAMGTATAKAGAIADPAWMAAQAELAKANIKSETLGNITSSASDILNLFTGRVT